MERREIMISDNFYVFTFTGTDLEFCVDPDRSVRHIEPSADEIEAEEQQFDVFDNRHDGEKPPGIRLYRRAPLSFPLKVYKEAMKFASTCPGKYRPPKLKFETLELDKWGLYARAAGELGKKFGCHVYSWRDDKDEESQRFQLSETPHPCDRQLSTF